MIHPRGVTKEFSNAVLSTFLDLHDGELPSSSASGCGKTTTLKMVNRLIRRPGDNLIDGKTLKKSMPLQNIGYVIQQDGLFHMTIRQNIELIQRLEQYEQPLRTILIDEDGGLVLGQPGPLPDGAVRRPAQRIGVIRAHAGDPTSFCLTSFPP
ncbi:MAG: ATP-binding cassette domain-containing protein [Clostridia bacterium]